MKENAVVQLLHLAREAEDARKECGLISISAAPGPCEVLLYEKVFEELFSEEETTHAKLNDAQFRHQYSAEVDGVVFECVSEEALYDD